MPPTLLHWRASWGCNPFNNCKSLRHVDWGDCMVDETYSMYMNCSAIDYYEGILPLNLKTLNGIEFCFCTSLTRMIFYEGITDFGGEIFRGCTSLRYVEFPASTTAMSMYRLFLEVPRDRLHVVIKAINPPTFTDVASGWWMETVRWYVPDESVEAYKATEALQGVASQVYPISELPDEYRAMGTLPFRGD